jgi:16S rRNA C967 or C1407 C5-methylase (RsmB/RsmF family)/NOL1/NOP2/fmu family ribosome biogenesis protein
MAARNKATSSRRTNQINWSLVLGPLAEHLAPEMNDLDAATNMHPRRAIRLAPGRSDSDLPMEVEPVPWYRQGYYVVARDIRPGEWLHYAAGDYYIQDAGSMLALALCQLKKGDWVCDLCAAPGGKATGALEQLDGTGMLVANEVIGSRLGVLQQALARTGYTNYLTMSHEVDELSVRLGDTFNCVIVDAPCTGQTMVGRGKQVLAAYSAAQIEHSAARQRRIIRAAGQLVAPGGKLVYSTCAFSYAENEQIIIDFLADHPGWSLRLVPELADWQSPGVEGCYRVWPHRDPCAGAFAAALVRPGSSSEASYQPSTSSQPAASDRPQLFEQIDWLKIQPNEFHWQQKGRWLHAFPACTPKPWLADAVGGIAIAEQQTDRWEPSFAAACLRSSWIEPRLNLELDDRQAARFVGGEALPLPADHQGWARVCWQQRPLGWGKLVGGVLKNHYPKSLRQHQHA